MSDSGKNCASRPARSPDRAGLGTHRKKWSQVVDRNLIRLSGEFRLSWVSNTFVSHRIRATAPQAACRCAPAPRRAALRPGRGLPPLPSGLPPPWRARSPSARRCAPRPLQPGPGSAEPRPRAPRRPRPARAAPRAGWNAATSAASGAGIRARPARTRSRASAASVDGTELRAAPGANCSSHRCAGSIPGDPKRARPRARWWFLSRFDAVVFNQASPGYSSGFRADEPKSSPGGALRPRDPPSTLNRSTRDARGRKVPPEGERRPKAAGWAVRSQSW